MNAFYPKQRVCKHSWGKVRKSKAATPTKCTCARALLTFVTVCKWLVNATQKLTPLTVRAFFKLWRILVPLLWDFCYSQILSWCRLACSPLLQPILQSRHRCASSNLNLEKHISLLLFQKLQYWLASTSLSARSRVKTMLEREALWTSYP